MKTIRFFFIVLVFSMTVVASVSAYDGMIVWEGGIGTEVAQHSAIRVADLDGDADHEIVVGNRQGFLHVIGRVDGAYEHLWKSPNMGTSAFGVAVGDTDGDTMPEIVAGNGEGFFYVFGWNGDTWVQEHVSADIGREIWGIAIGNTDADAGNEIVMGSREGFVWVFGFDGDSYVQEWVSADLDQWVLDVSVADADGDTDLDIVVGGGRVRRAYIYEWNGAGYDQTWESDELQSQNYGIGVANLDGDASPELIASTLWGFLYVFSPFEAGGETPEWTSADIGSYPYTPVPGDVDGDTVIEFVVGNSDGDIPVFAYSVDTYVLEDTISTGDASSNFGVAVAIGDPDNDMDPEWVSGGNSGIVRVFGWQEGDGYVQEWYSGPPNGPMHALAAGDLNGDGTGEAAVGITANSGGEEVFILDEDTGDYVVKWTWPSASGVAGGSMVVDELDGTAGNEFALYSRDDDKIHLFQYSGDTWIEEGASNAVVAMGSTVALTTGNYDGGAHAAIAMPEGAGSLHVFSWNGIILEETWSGFLGFNQIWAAVSADTDGDMLDEIIMLDMMGRIHVWGWNGADYVEEWASISGTFGGVGVAVADGDGDMVVEIAAGDSAANLLVYSFSEGSYTEEADLALGSGTITGIGAGDVDADGKVEFVVYGAAGTLTAVGYDTGVWAVEGTATGLPPSAAGMGTPNPVAAADLDGVFPVDVIVCLDGYLEIIQFPDAGPPDVAVLTPNGSERIEAESVYEITWTATDIVGVDRVDIAYSTNSGTDWTPVSAAEPNDGSFNWPVPSTPSTECLVGVTAWDAAGNSAFDTSDDLFEIYLLTEPDPDEAGPDDMEEVIEEDIAEQADDAGEDQSEALEEVMEAVNETVEEAAEETDVESGVEVAEFADMSEDIAEFLEEAEAEVSDISEVAAEEIEDDIREPVMDGVVEAMDAGEDDTVTDVTMDTEEIHDAADVEEEDRDGSGAGCGCLIVL